MRIAVPSWVIPGTYGENLRFLQKDSRIDTVELLFFLYDEEVRAQLDTEWPIILEYAERFRYTVHLPDALTEDHEELIVRLLPLADHFVTHPGDPAKADTLAELISGWSRQYSAQSARARLRAQSQAQSLSRAQSQVPARSRTLAQSQAQSQDFLFILENTQGNRLEALRERLPKAGLCMDTGHLLLAGMDPADYYISNKELIQEIHLHGVDREAAKSDGRLPDHRSISGREPWFQRMEYELRSFKGIVNTEVFSWAEAERSLRSLGERGLLVEGASHE